MKQSLLILAILAFSVQTSNAQWWGSNKKINGNGDFTSQTRTVSEYDQVSLQGSMKVELIAGKEGKLTIEAESNLSEYILTEVSGGKLKISVEKGVSLNPSRNKGIKIRVPFKTLNQVSLTGSGDIFSSDQIKAERFEIDLTGSGDINLDLQAKNVKGSITGSGDIFLRGKARDFRCIVTGSGDFDASKLEAERVDASVSGSGNIMVHASRELKSRVTGSGDIEYKGNPQMEDFRTSGSGSVSKM